MRIFTCVHVETLRFHNLSALEMYGFAVPLFDFLIFQTFISWGHVCFQNTIRSLSFSILGYVVLTVECVFPANCPVQCRSFSRSVFDIVSWLRASILCSAVNFSTYVFDTVCFPVVSCS